MIDTSYNSEPPQRIGDNSLRRSSETAGSYPPGSLNESPSRQASGPEMNEVRPASTLPPRTWSRWPILSVWVDDLSMDELLSQLDARGGVVFTFNPDHAYHQHYNDDFLRAYRSADFITMDSNYLLTAMRLRGLPLRNRLTGSDIVPAYLRRHASRADTSVFLLGARPGVAAIAARRANEAAGRQIVVGAHGPSMNFLEDEREIAEVIEMINSSGATTVFVALGAPKQEVWIARHRHRMPGVKVFMGVGATIDYAAGVVRRAPVWLRSVGLEWTYRVVTEPRRYFMRYLRNSRVFWWVIQEHLGAYQKAHAGTKENR